MVRPVGLRSRAAGLGLLALLLAAGPTSAQQGLSALQIDVDAVTRAANPSIVTISAERTVITRARRDPTPRSRTHTRVGTGVAVAEDEVLTTASVISGATRIVLTASNGLQSEAVVAGVDEVFNVALLRVRSMRLPPLRFAEGRPAEIGDWVIGLGRSFGMKSTQSVGYVTVRYQEPHSALIQTTNTAYPGNSGGAALNPLGEVVGLITGELVNREVFRMESDERNPASVTFVIPAEDVRRVYEGLHAAGRVRHGYMGVTTGAASVPSDTRPGLEVPIGARVEAVVAGGPGEKVGLKVGDLIVGFGDERVEIPAQLARWTATSPPGTTERLVWVRDELQHDGKVTLGESPYAAPQWAKRGASGDDKRAADLQRRIQELNRQLGEIQDKKTPKR